MKVYLDNSAATYIEPRVLKAMMPYLKKKYGNPSSFHNKGKETRDAVEKAREQIAEVLNCASGEIIFTGGGTEANNMAILGVITRINADITRIGAEVFKPHIITTKIEHPSVLETCKYLEKSGQAGVTYLNVDKYGLVDLRELKKSLRPETVLVSVIYANNEIGTIQDIEKISSIIKNRNKIVNTKYPLTADQPKVDKIRDTLLHTDACQAGGYLTLDIKKLGVDTMTINSSKIYGPKGIGALYVKNGVKLAPIMFGGHQELGLRPGTENVAGVVGFGEAIKIAEKSKIPACRQAGKMPKSKLRNYFLHELFKRIPKIRLNGHKTKRLPNNINISILDVEGEALILRLNEKGIYCSTGSACASGSLEPSRVIMALGVPYEAAHGSLRFTLGRKTTKKEIDYVLKVLPKIVADLRAISPVKMKK